MTEGPFTYDDLKDILVERIGLADTDVPAELSTAFVELGLDSLAVVEIQLALQQDHGVTIPDEDADSLLTFADAIDYVNAQRLPEEVS